jgi:hypothetical protein
MLRGFEVILLGRPKIRGIAVGTLVREHASPTLVCNTGSGRPTHRRSWRPKRLLPDHFSTGGVYQRGNGVGVEEVD